MNARSLAALVLINAALLAGLVVTLFTPQRAEAQFGGGSQYLMIAGQTKGMNDASLVYILDVRTARMIAVVYNASNDELSFVAARDMRNDITSGAGRQRGGR